MEEQLQDYEVIVAKRSAAHLRIIFDTCGKKCLTMSIDKSGVEGYIIYTTRSNIEKLKQYDWVLSVNHYEPVLIRAVDPLNAEDPFKDDQS